MTTIDAVRLLLVRHAMPAVDPATPAAQWHLSPRGRAAARDLRPLITTPACYVASTEPKALETLQEIAASPAAATASATATGPTAATGSAIAAGSRTYAGSTTAAASRTATNPAAAADPGITTGPVVVHNANPAVTHNADPAAAADHAVTHNADRAVAPHRAVTHNADPAAAADPAATHNADPAAAHNRAVAAADSRFAEVRRPSAWTDGLDYRAAARAYLQGADHDGWEPRVEVAARFDRAVLHHAAVATAAGSTLVIGTHGLALTLWLASRFALAPDPAGFWEALQSPTSSRSSLPPER